MLDQHMKFQANKFQEHVWTMFMIIKTLIMLMDLKFFNKIVYFMMNILINKMKQMIIHIDVLIILILKIKKLLT